MNPSSLACGERACVCEIRKCLQQPRKTYVTKDSAARPMALEYGLKDPPCSTIDYRGG